MTLELFNFLSEILVSAGNRGSNLELYIQVSFHCSWTSQVINQSIFCKQLYNAESTWLLFSSTGVRITTSNTFDGTFLKRSIHVFRYWCYLKYCIWCYLLFWASEGPLWLPSMLNHKTSEHPSYSVIGRELMVGILNGSSIPLNQLDLFRRLVKTSSIRGPLQSDLWSQS